VRAVNDGAGRPNEIRPRDWGLAAVAVTPLLVLAAVAIVSVGHGYHGTGDNGMAELRISDIGHHWPEIGVFSRDGWSHPGPALFYVLLLPYRLTGSHSNGLLVGAALVNAVAVAGMTLLARRRGGTALALLVALGSLVVLAALGGTFLWQPWNPYLPVLPFGLAVLATWCVVCGDAWCLPVVAVVGSFCAQTHVGYVPLVAALLLVAVAGLVLHVRSAPEAGSPARRVRAPMLVAAALLVVCWLPTIFQQLTADPGNLSAIWDFFTSSRRGHTLSEGFDVVTAQFAWNPEWLVGAHPVNPFAAQPAGLTSASLPLWWLALGVALAWTWATGRRVARALGVVLVLTIVASIVSIARTLGPVYEYRLRFLWVLGMLTAAYSVWALVQWVSDRVRPPGRWSTPAAGVVLVAVVGLSAYVTATAAQADPPNRSDGRIVAALMPPLLHHLPAGPGVVVATATTFTESRYIAGVMVDLEHAGIPVRIRDGRDDRLRYGDHRMLAGEPIRADLRIAADDQIDIVAKAPCARMLAYWGRASRAARARALRATQRIQRALARHQIGDAAALHRLAHWSADLPAVAVFDTRCARR
jgi:hypothetical protein